MSYDFEALYERAVDAAYIIKGRELSYTEEAWIKAGAYAVLAALSEGDPERAEPKGVLRSRAFVSGTCPVCLQDTPRTGGESL